MKISLKTLAVKSNISYSSTYSVHIGALSTRRQANIQSVSSLFLTLEVSMKKIQAFCISVCLSICAVGGWAQSTATLSGIITDPSGAVVPKAHVTVHSLSTGADRTIDTDSAGLYAVPSLQPGNYSVSVEAAGFAAYKLPGITLQVDQSVTANAKLGVASTGEVVEVQGAAPILDAATMTVGWAAAPLESPEPLELQAATTVPPISAAATAAATLLNRMRSSSFQIRPRPAMSVVRFF